MPANSFEDSNITEKYNAALNPEVNCIQNRQGVLPKDLGLLETLTLFQSKICDFHYPISDLRPKI